jgi:phospholipase C
VRPPRVPDIRNSTNPDQDFGQMGLRIPAVTVSPWVRRGHVSHSIFGFESILKMIEYRFGIDPLTRRDAYAQTIAHSFDFESKPRLALPDLPDPPAVAGHQCSNQAPGPKTQADHSQRPKEHDLGYLLSSGYLDRLGFKYRPATAASTYRHPHMVESRLRGR